VIQYDKLGTCLSDPIAEVPTLESRADELRAVLDAAGSERPAHEFAENIPSARLVEREGVDHFPPSAADADRPVGS
jgi:hypothetical protein